MQVWNPKIRANLQIVCTCEHKLVSQTVGQAVITLYTPLPPLHFGNSVYPSSHIFSMQHCILTIKNARDPPPTSLSPYHAIMRHSKHPPLLLLSLFLLLRHVWTPGEAVVGAVRGGAPHRVQLESDTGGREGGREGEREREREREKGRERLVERERDEEVENSIKTQIQSSKLHASISHFPYALLEWLTVNARGR